MWIRFIACSVPGEMFTAKNTEALSRLKKKAAGYNLELIPGLIRHIGTDLCGDVLRKIREKLNGQVDLIFDRPVQQIRTAHGHCFQGHDPRRQGL